MSKNFEGPRDSSTFRSISIYQPFWVDVTLNDEKTLQCIKFDLFLYDSYNSANISPKVKQMTVLESLDSVDLF